MAALLDQYGNPIKATVIKNQQTDSPSYAMLRRTFSENVSLGLDIRKLPAILQAADEGDLRAQADLFSQMEEKDAHIHAEMAKRRKAILTLDWTVNPPRNASAKEKDMTAEVLEWCLDLPNFEEFLLDLLDAIGQGFSAVEIEWQRIDGLWLPKAFHHRPPRWFKTPIDNRNELRLDNMTVDGEVLQPFGWVVHRHKAKSGYIAQTGLGRVLVWPYLYKNYSVLDLADFLDVYGFPIRVGKYGKGVTEQDKNTLMRALVVMGREAAGIIPDEMTIDFQDAVSGDAKSFEVMINWCEKVVSKAVLGSTLTSQADGKSSTNALGNIHNEVRHDLLTSDARQLASTLTRDLLYPMLIVNGYDVDIRRMPNFAFDTRQPEDMKLYADSIPYLVQSGMKIPLGWAHEKLAIPLPQDNEPILTITQAAPQKLPATMQLPSFAALKAQEETLEPAQQAIEDAPSVITDTMTQAMSNLLSPIVASLKQGTPPETAMAMLVKQYPKLDTTALDQLMSQALFVSDLWGRINE